MSSETEVGRMCERREERREVGGDILALYLLGLLKDEGLC